MLEFELEGLRELERAIEAMPAGLHAQVMGAATQAMAREVAKEARKLVPVRTGALKASIRVRRFRERFRGRQYRSAAGVYAGGPGARHAPLIEYGTFLVPANPFMRTAIMNTRNAQHAAFVRSATMTFERLVRQLATGTGPASVARLAVADIR